MILCIYLVRSLELNIKLSEHFIWADNGPFKGSKAPMVILGAYIFKDLNIGKTKPEEPLTDAYVDEVYDSEHAHTATKLLRVIFDTK